MPMPPKTLIRKELRNPSRDHRRSVAAPIKGGRKRPRDDETRARRGKHAQAAAPAREQGQPRRQQQQKQHLRERASSRAQDGAGKHGAKALRGDRHRPKAQIDARNQAQHRRESREQRDIGDVLNPHSLRMTPERSLPVLEASSSDSVSQCVCHAENFDDERAGRQDAEASWRLWFFWRSEPPACHAAASG